MLFVPSFVFFQIFYFSTDLLMFFSYSSFNLSVLMRRVQRNLVVDPLHGIPVSYCLSCGPLILFSKVSSASLISQSGSNGMYRDYIAFAVYSNSQATMDIMLPSPRLEEPSTGQSHNLLNKQYPFCLLIFYYISRHR